MSSSATTIGAPTAPPRPTSGLWITCWQARYPAGDAGSFASPLRREVPRRIHRRVPQTASRPRNGLASPPHRTRARTLHVGAPGTRDLSSPGHLPRIVGART